MTIHREPVPCRVQVWVDGTCVEIRGWLDQLELSQDMARADFDGWTNYTPSGKSFHLSGHAGKPWRFGRGKPRLPEASV